MTRFWTDVAVVPDASGHALALDGRPVNTPGRLRLIVPGRALAEAIADEWRAVGDTVDPRAMRLTGLANAAVERVAPERSRFADAIAGYADTDLLLYRADTPPALVERQGAMWDPPLDWARHRYDIHFEPVHGILHRPQPQATLTRLGEAVAARPAFELAALQPIVTLTGSLILGLMLAERAAGPDAVWEAANCDADWQAEQWGQDSLAAETRAAHRAEFDAATRFLTLFQQAADEPDQPGLA